MATTAHLSDADPVAPLGAPALVLAATMLLTPLLVIDEFAGWAADYGSLVYVALGFYFVGALRLARWGVTVRSPRRAVRPRSPATRW